MSRLLEPNTYLPAIIWLLSVFIFVPPTGLWWVYLPNTAYPNVDAKCHVMRTITVDFTSRFLSAVIVFVTLGRGRGVITFAIWDSDWTNRSTKEKQKQKQLPPPTTTTKKKKKLDLRFWQFKHSHQTERRSFTSGTHNTFGPLKWRQSSSVLVHWCTYPLNCMWKSQQSVSQIDRSYQLHNDLRL